MRRAALCTCLLFSICGVVCADVYLEKGVNQLQNWDFEQGILGLCVTQPNGSDPGLRRCVVPDVWQIEDYTPAGTGTIELDDKEIHDGNFSLKVTTTSIDETDWHFKLEQSRMSFEGGKKHTIKFWAKAEAPRMITVVLQMSHEPWIGYFYRDVNLTPDWQEFVMEVIPPVDNDQEHWLAFHCGQSLTTWWLDDVRYYKGSPNDEKESRPSIGSDDLKTQIAGELEPSALHVEGSRLVTADGSIVRLQGVSIPTLGISNTGGDRLLESLRVAIHDWNSNTIRLPLSQERWFGEAEGQRYGGQLYRLIVDEVVRYISENGCYVILELQALGIGPSGKEIYTMMPDMKSVEFWRDLATHYANDPAALFELYNEVHDVSWDVWKFGGWVTENEITYEASGMQELLNVVRSTEARNIAVVGGLDWAYDLRGIPEYALEDPYGNVMYATHIYPWKGKEKDWNENIGHVIGKYPILVGEVGSEPGAWSPYPDYDPYIWSDEVLSYIHKHELNWTAWCFDVLAGPPLLADWDYNPTPYWGDFVKRALRDVPYIGDAVPPWDVDMDGRVDILDLIQVVRHLGKVVTTPLHPDPDVNGDGAVDVSDIILVSQHFGEVY
ncbi:cellulase family glycosylhydrolase [Candidatus Poribacteria bacterium]